MTFSLWILFSLNTISNQGLSISSYPLIPSLTVAQGELWAPNDSCSICSHRHSFCSDLWSVYYFPSTLLCCWDQKVNKFLYALCLYWAKTNKWQRYLLNNHTNGQLWLWYMVHRRHIHAMTAYNCALIREKIN